MDFILLFKDDDSFQRKSEFEQQLYRSTEADA